MSFEIHFLHMISSTKKSINDIFNDFRCAELIHDLLVKNQYTVINVNQESPVGVIHLMFLLNLVTSFDFYDKFEMRLLTTILGPFSKGPCRG